MNKSSSILHGHTKCCVCLLPFTTIYPISTKHLEACLLLGSKRKKNLTLTNVRIRKSHLVERYVLPQSPQKTIFPVLKLNSTLYLFPDYVLIPYWYC